MKYDAVIFDLYGTLVPNMDGEDYDATLRRTATAVGADPDAFIAHWSDRELVAMRVTGQFGTQANCIREVCRRLGLAPRDDAVERAGRVRADFVREIIVPRDDTVETLRTLKARGVKLCLLTSCSPDAPSAWAETPMAPWFDGEVFSCRAGVDKPDRRIYRLACESVGVAPGRALFVGDGANRELTGAVEAGLDAALMCAVGEQDVVMQRDDPAQWTGPVVKALGEVVGLVDSGEAGR
jgi:putative hydrolase of the HAD superfamily